MVNKITSPITPLGEIDKINEIIDNLGSSSIDVDSALSTTSENPVQNKVITSALDGKLDKSGGTMTGNLTVGISSITPNGYLKGAWLQTNAATYLDSATDIAVLSNGWIYKQSKNTLLSGVVKSVNDISPDSNGNVALSIPTVNNATLTITQGGTTKGTFTANASSNVTIDLDAGGGGATRNIGEIVSSTIPLTDAGLHLLDGALISGSGVYSAFVTYIAGLVSTYPDLFTTESAWQSTVTQYGVCGKFVYNSTNNTVRLPKITGFVEGASGTATLGDLTEAGLPNITGWFADGSGNNAGLGNDYSYTQVNGCFGKTSIGNGKTLMCTSSSYDAGRIDFDASNSSSIYGNSSTVQPQTIKVLYYIVIATSTKTDIQVDIDEIATDLNGKADVDLTNVNNSGTSLGAGWAMPSGKHTTLTVGASGTSYTAPANGWFYINVGFTNTSGTVRLNSPTLSIRGNANAGAATSTPVSVYMPISKNQKAVVEYANVKTFYTFAFFAAVGSESEVS